MRDKTSLSFRQNVKSLQTIGDGPQRPTEHDGLRGVADVLTTKHIHPCVCDLSTEQLKRVQAHRRKLLEAQQRYEARIRRIYEELERHELEALDRLQGYDMRMCVFLALLTR